ncbi:universal stress protein [Maribacter sp. 2307ULW6-5]|uniref:universal stress protein n=1 Tax=Maribacter sp. 2307ULW6-5 TaxID=3386275 RepID=UPI0039BD49D6
MTRVLLPTDFSENAYHAIQYAIQLFRGKPAHFYLLHTYTPPVFHAAYIMGSPGHIGLGDDQKVRATERLKELKERVVRELADPQHQFSLRAAFNGLAEEIAAMAKREKVHLVVMGTQGATGATEILFGSHTVQAIQKSGCPVIAVPSKYEMAPLEHILFPTDFEIDYASTPLDLLLDICQTQGARLTVMHVSSGHPKTEAQKEHRAALAARLSQTDHAMEELPDQDLITAINGFQEKYPIQLLAMVRNKHTFFERLFIEPVIKKLGLHISIPFMVLPYQVAPKSEP